MHSVLIIDDNREEAIDLKESLRKENYKVYISYRLKEGLIKAKDKKPDLMIVDTDDVNTDTFDLIREIRTDADFNSVYLIVVSYKSDDFDKVLSLELGADDYLAKPINRKELLARMKSMSKYKRKSYYGYDP